MANSPDATTVRRSARLAARQNHEVRKLAQRLDGRYQQNLPVQSAVTAGRNQVQIGGMLYPAEGIEGQGAAVAVVNVGTPAVAKYAPSQRTSVVGLAGSGLAGGGGGGSGPVYLAGDGIAIDGSNTISVKRDAAGAIILGTGNALKINVGDGIQIVTNALTLNLATNPGLEYGTAGDAGKVRVKAGNGITRDSTGVLINLATDPGLEFSTGQVRVKAYHGITRDANGVGVKLLSGMTAMAVDANGVAIANAIAGAGLTINATTKVMAVGAGDGIDVNADDVAVDVTDIINVAYGLYEPSSNDIGINIVGNTGLAFTGGNALAIGTPSSSSVSSSNTVTSSTHAHAVTTSSDVGTTPAAAILASNASGQLTLAQLTLRGNLVFAGGDRSITASNNLTLAPTTDLILDPTGLILLPNAQEMKTSTFSDLVTGISGMRFWDRGSNYRQLTIGAMKMDELYARVFVADETRIDRGEEYWSKSFGVVETDFVMPSLGADVDVWFEDAAALATANLFSVGDWLLMRMVDWGTGIVVMKCWFTVEDAGVNDYVSKDATNKRQQWRLKRKKYGSAGTVVKKGNTLLDAGQVGQGWIHLSALDQDGGPFVQVGDFTSVVSNEPVFTNRVRMGNLNGTVDYVSNTWGQAGGNDLGSTPSTGYSGYTVDATNGLRIFNTEIVLYESSTPMVKINKTTGMTIDFDSAAGATVGRYIRWQDDVNTIDANNNARIGGYKNGSANGLGLLVTSASANSEIRMDAFNIANGDFSQLFLYSTHAYLQHNAGLGWRSDPANGVIVGRVDANASSRFHVYENTTATGAAAGATIEQDSTGDAVLHWYLTAGQYFSAGIDNSASDAFVISRSSDLGTNPIFSLSTAGAASFTGTLGVTGAATLSSTLAVTGAATFAADLKANSTFTLSPGGSQDYQFGDDGGVALTLQSKNAGADFDWRIFTEDADGTDNIGISLWAKGKTGATTNRERFRLIYAAASQQFWINSEAAGTGTVRPIVLYTGSNSNQLFLTTAGDIGVGTATPGENLIGTTDYASSRILQVDGTNAVLLLRGSATAKFDLIDTGGTADQRWFRFVMDGNKSYMRAVDDNDFGYLSLMTFDHNTGAAGIGTTAPSGTESTSKLTVEGSAAGSVYAAVINTGAGQAGLVLRRTGTTPSRWVQYIPSGSPQLRFYSGTLGDDVLTLSELGYVGINEASPATMLDVGAEGVNSIRSTVYGNTAYFNYVGRRALGTKASPTQITNGQILVSIGGLGYTNGGWATGTSAEIHVVSYDTFDGGTSGRRGGLLRFFTVGTGTTTQVNRMEIQQDGALYVPYIWNTAVNGTAVQINSNGILTKATSSIRYKKNVRRMPDAFGDEFVMRLRPIVYNNKHGDDASDYVGLVAEEVYESGGEPFIALNNGLVESLHYDKLTVPLIGAVQGLIPYKQRIAELERRVAELEMRLN